jgi:hypothetical protein
MATTTPKISQLRWYLFEEYVRMLEQSSYPPPRHKLISSIKRQVTLYRKPNLAGRVFLAFTRFTEGWLHEPIFPLSCWSMVPKDIAPFFRKRLELQMYTVVANQGSQDS